VNTSSAPGEFQFDDSPNEFQFEEMPKLNTSPPVEKLRSVAKGQRLVMIALLVNIAGNVAYKMLDTSDEAMNYAGIAIVLCTGLFAMYAVFHFARLFSSTFFAFLYAILMLVPFISIIGLLITNQKALSFLKRYDVKLGFFGAHLDSIK
jgi:hypothetical protein